MRMLAVSVLVLASLIGSASAQVVNVDVSFQNPDQQVCGPRGCQVIKGSVVTNRGSGVIIGKTKGGQSLVLSCNHILTGPAGSKHVGMTVGGIKAGLLRGAKNDDDLSVLWTEAPLNGGTLRLADADPVVGQELSVWAFDPGLKTKPAIRSAKIKRKNVIGLAVKDGNSGGPVVGKNLAVYGIVWGYTKPTRENPNPQESYFTPVSRIREFLRTPSPIDIALAHETTTEQSQFSTECPPCPPCPVFPPYPTTGPVWPGFDPAYPTTGPVLPGFTPPVIPDNSLPGGSAPIVTDNLTIISPNVNLVPSPGVPQPTPTVTQFDSSVPYRLGLVESQVRNLHGRVQRLEAGNPFLVWRWNWWLRLHFAERRINNLDLRVRALEYRGY